MKQDKTRFNHNIARYKVKYSKYYNEIFRDDLFNFTRRIPFNRLRHYNQEVKSIQYFNLTPNYDFLDVIPEKRKREFIVTLFWIVLMDQVCYTYFKMAYPTFQENTKYPKFIGNCTAISLAFSDCGHNQHPSKILFAVNDYMDKGNRFASEKQRFEAHLSDTKRDKIDFSNAFEMLKPIMKEEIKNYFQNNQPDIDWIEFWKKCCAEIPECDVF